jgi:MtrB/PioB family decaheme-associated outer membrane protein
LLAALDLLTYTGVAVAAPDTSNWKCTSCPYPKGTSGSVQAGVAAVSDASYRFGDTTGLQKQGLYLDLGGSLQYRSETGTFADLMASDLGLDTRSLSARGGQEGLFTLKLAYGEIPRWFTDGALSPFQGIGGSNLTLPTTPAGFPAAGTSTMPLAATLQPVAVGYKQSRLDLGGTWVAIDDWTLHAGFRRDVRDGTKLTTGSFFASSSQLVAPVDQVTEHFELSAAYATRKLQAALGFHVSRFSNAATDLSWSNPFWPATPGATRGQLALAPDNLLQQVTGSAGYDLAPSVRVSADFAYGWLTQNAAFLPSTQNTVIAAGLAALPAASLDGQVETFNANVKVTATPFDKLRLTALYAHDARDNRTSLRSYPQVTADTFVDAVTRTNVAFGMTQDRLKLNAEYRGFEPVKLSAGVDQDNRQRPYTEVVTTRETTVWGRAGAQPLDNLSLMLKLAHADRKHSDYGTATWFGAPENPLLRKYNLANRQRDSAGLRADLSLGEKLSLGLSLDGATDDYGASMVGLQSARSVSAGVDATAAIAANTRLTVFAQTERIKSAQAGSQSGGVPDWSARNKDTFNVIGLSLKHDLIADRFTVGADITSSRSSSDVSVDAGGGGALFPAARTVFDSAKLTANYKLQDQLWLDVGFGHQHYSSQDWRLDGVLPATVQNLLSLGVQAPQYSVSVLKLGLRYRY